MEERTKYYAGQNVDERVKRKSVGSLNGINLFIWFENRHRDRRRLQLGEDNWFRRIRKVEREEVYGGIQMIQMKKHVWIKVVVNILRWTEHIQRIH